MRHPLWLLNSLLLGIIVLALGFALMSRQTLPKKLMTKVKPTHIQKPQTSESVDITKIYENDLFNTYREILAPVEETHYVKPIPNPPTTSPVVIPEEPKQPFFPPLDASLKGVMMVNDDSLCIAMIMNNKTKKESNYKIGDIIEDAQIVKILPTKILLIRSNSQQETLYLTEKDIANDPVLTQEEENWIHVIKKVSDNSYSIDPTTFVQSIPNLGFFIDMLNISTVYKSGKSIGCKIGKVTPKSIGESMGLQQNDIVQKIYGISAETIEQRLQIYEKIKNTNLNENFTIEILRANNPITLTIMLENFENNLDNLAKQASAPETMLQSPSPDEIELEYERILKEKYAFAQTTQDILIAQKKAMLHEGKEERLQDFSLSNNV